MRFFKSIKFRLTVWYLAVIAVLLLVFGTAAYFMLSHSLYQNQDDSLRTRLTEVGTSLKVEDGRVNFPEKLSELVLIFDAGGTLLQQVGPYMEFSNMDELVRRTLFGQSTFLTAITTYGQEVRLYAAPFTTGSNTRIAIVVGRLTSEIQDVLVTFRSILTGSALTVVLAAGIGGLFLANRALKPVDRITGTAQEIGESGALSRRIDVSSEDELGRLASTLNLMIERLEDAFNRQRQFTADASHELRTPLAVIQAESTLSLEKERTREEYRKSLELVSQEVAYMSAVVGKLLFLARSDARKEPLNLEGINLKELLAELSTDVEVLAKDKGLQYSLGTMEDLTVRGDRVKLKQLFLGILENAVRYTASGSISSSLVSRDGSAVVTVRDSGIGIPSEHLPFIFERFYRVDKARSRAEGGTGLGLAIAKSIAEAHNGGIEVESETGVGSTFRVILPLVSQPATPV